MCTTSAFASLSNLSLSKTMRSPKCMNPTSCASNALLLTCDVRIISKAFRTKGMGSALGIRIRGFTNRRNISLHPPPAGTRPIPTSTKPILSSTFATTRLDARTNSAAPPSVRPNGAATTGFVQYLIFCIVF